MALRSRMLIFKPVLQESKRTYLEFILKIQLSSFNKFFCIVITFYYHMSSSLQVTGLNLLENPIIKSVIYNSNIISYNNIHKCINFYWYYHANHYIN